MMFAANGTVHTAGWTFHGPDPESTKQANRDGAPGQRKAQASAAAPAEVLAAVSNTSRRHQHNRALRAAGLTKPDWHDLFRALIEAESAFRPDARSPKGAIGLGQLMPETARELGVDPHDMEQNLDGAARYLLTQLSDFGSVDLALAAYNAGPHRVAQYSGVPPFRETRHYISQITKRIRQMERARNSASSSSPSSRKIALLADR